MRRLITAAMAAASLVATAADMHQEFGWKDSRRVMVAEDMSASQKQFSCTMRARNEYLIAKNHDQRLRLDYTPEGECRLTVGTGQWDDHYARTSLRDADGIQVDHVVPLREAWDAGASTWTRSERRKFSTDPLNLRITTSSTNGRKKDLPVYDYAKWAPEGFRLCEYAKQYASVKAEYALTFTEREIDFYAELAGNGGCPTNVVTSKMFGGYKSSKWVKVR